MTFSELAGDISRVDSTQVEEPDKLSGLSEPNPFKDWTDENKKPRSNYDLGFSLLSDYFTS